MLMPILPNNSLEKRCPKCRIKVDLTDEASCKRVLGHFWKCKACGHVFHECATR